MYGGRMVHVSMRCQDLQSFLMYAAKFAELSIFASL